MPKPRQVNKLTYLTIDGAYMGSREFLKTIERKTNERIIAHSREVAHAIRDQINEIIQELVQAHPTPKWSVWRKYKCYVEKERITYDKNNFAEYTCDIVVRSRWKKFNLFEVLERGGLITFKENAIWPVLDGRQISVGGPTAPIQINHVDFSYDTQGHVEWRTRFGSGRSIKEKGEDVKRVVYYDKLYLFQRVVNQLDRNHPRLKDFQAARRSSTYTFRRRKVPSVQFEINFKKGT